MKWSSSVTAALALTPLAAANLSGRTNHKEDTQHNAADDSKNSPTVIVDNSASES